MNAERLLYSLNEVGEDLLDASGQTFRRRPARRFAWIGAAASLALIVGLGFAGWRLLAARRPARAEPPVSEVRQTALPLSDFELDTLSPEAEDGFAVLLWEDENRIMFYGSFGFVCYDLSPSPGIVFTVDPVKAVGHTANPHDSAGCRVEVSADGSTVGLEYLDAETGCKHPCLRIDVASQTCEYRDNAPPLTLDGEERQFEGRLVCGQTLRELRYERAERVWEPFAGTSAVRIQPGAIGDLALDPGWQRLPVGKGALDYTGEDGNLLILHGSFGLVCYSLADRSVRFTVDFEKAVGTQDVRVEVSGDGRTILLSANDGGGTGFCCLYPQSGSWTRVDEPATVPAFDPSKPMGELVWVEGGAVTTLQYREFNDDQVYLLFPEDDPKTARELPKLAFDAALDSAEGLSEADFLAATENSLWTEARAASDPALRTLPVFENQEIFRDALPDRDWMIALLEHTLDLLGEEQRVGISDPAVQSATVPETITQTTDRVTVTVTNRGRVTVRYAKPLPYPESPEYDRSDPRKARENYVNFLFNLLEIPWKQSWELDVQSTRAAIDPRYASGRSTSAWEERILADLMRNLELELDAEGLLGFSYDDDGIGFRGHWLPLGDYPILTATAAWETYDPYAQQPPAGVQLVYSTGFRLLAVPCYRFWEQSADGSYRYYDVPAVRPQYLEQG